MQQAFRLHMTAHRQVLARLISEAEVTSSRRSQVPKKMQPKHTGTPIESPLRGTSLVPQLIQESVRGSASASLPCAFLLESLADLEYASCEQGGKSGVLACFVDFGTRLPPLPSVAIAVFPTTCNQLTVLVRHATWRRMALLPSETLCICAVHGCWLVWSWWARVPCCKLNHTYSWSTQNIAALVFSCYRGHHCCTASSASSEMSARWRSLAFVTG